MVRGPADGQDTRNVNVQQKTSNVLLTHENVGKVAAQVSKLNLADQSVAQVSAISPNVPSMNDNQQNVHKKQSVEGGSQPNQQQYGSHQMQQTPPMHTQNQPQGAELRTQYGQHPMQNNVQNSNVNHQNQIAAQQISKQPLPGMTNTQSYEQNVGRTPQHGQQVGQSSMSQYDQHGNLLDQRHGSAMVQPNQVNPFNNQQVHASQYQNQKQQQQHEQYLPQQQYQQQQHQLQHQQQQQNQKHLQQQQHGVEQRQQQQHQVNNQSNVKGNPNAGTSILGEVKSAGGGLLGNITGALTGAQQKGQQPAAPHLAQNKTGVFGHANAIGGKRDI